MGYLQHTKCYLVGPVEHDKAFGRDWREVAAEECKSMGVVPYNPLDRPTWMKHIEPYIPISVSRDEVLDRIENNDKESERYILAQEFVRHICSRYVHSSDFLLCYLPNAKTFGSTEEIVLAHQARKPIIMVCPDRIPSLWIYDLVKDQHVFKNIKEAFCYMHQINDGEVNLDVLKWIFIQDYPKLILESKYDW